MGYDLMDRKRNVLIRELMQLVGRAKQLRGSIEETYEQAYAALQNANITLGVIDRFAEIVPVERSISVETRTVMGVEIPTVLADGSDQMLTYGLSVTNSALDDALMKFHRVKELTKELAELENTIYRLASAIKKTQKRANALQNIVIPGYEETITLITFSEDVYQPTCCCVT